MTVYPLTDLDKKLLNQLQKGFPVCERPFQQIAQEFGSTEDEVMARIQTLLDDGLLTRFGPMFDAACLGGAFTLAAMEIPEEDFEKVTEIVNAFEQIAHNYKRLHRLNMWFVVGTETPEEIEQVISEIEEQSGYPVFNMPKQEEFYVGLYLPV